MLRIRELAGNLFSVKGRVMIIADGLANLFLHLKDRGISLVFEKGAYFMNCGDLKNEGRTGVILILSLLLVFVCGCATNVKFQAPINVTIPGAINYRLDVRREPRPLRIHILEIDLAHPDLALDAIVTEDPDGNGVAEAVLKPPETLLRDQGILCAVNANAFASAYKNDANKGWKVSMPVDIKGWAQTLSRVASPPEQGYWSLWISAANEVKVGNPTKTEPAIAAVSGFTPLIIDGKIVTNKNMALHPRTAVGIDRSGRKLYLVVVDGRQKNYSEGMSLNELARLMDGLGCYNALNLDGGGSSIMFLRSSEGKLLVVNKPCVTPHRPIPVMLVVKKSNTISFLK